MRRLGLIAAAVASIVVFSGLAYYVGAHISRNTTVALTTCRQVNKIEGRIRTVIASADASLRMPGAPGYDYYRTHPMELARAHSNNVAAIREFDDLPC